MVTRSSFVLILSIVTLAAACSSPSSEGVDTGSDAALDASADLVTDMVPGDILPDRTEPPEDAAPDLVADTAPDAIPDIAPQDIDDSTTPDITPDTCQPDCEGKVCGDDGCGGSCGQCPGDQACMNGSSCVDIGLKWVSIPGGTFQMGCSPNDQDCNGDEYPTHSVTVSGYKMLETEVTEAQYEAVMDGNPSCNSGDGGGADNPVECLYWSNAKTFCEAIGGRLPTEAEWEYAARGGTTTRYYCGDDPECLSNIAWHYDNSLGMKHSVKKKEPNAYGLYDMLGNVWEWTNDWYDGSYYESSPSSNPQGPEIDVSRVSRGGGFGDPDGFYSLRVSRRGALNPSAGGYGDLGLRCARDVEP